MTMTRSTKPDAPLSSLSELLTFLDEWSPELIWAIDQLADDDQPPTVLCVEDGEHGNHTVALEPDDFGTEPIEPIRNLVDEHRPRIFGVAAMKRAATDSTKMDLWFLIWVRHGGAYTPQWFLSARLDLLDHRLIWMSAEPTPFDQLAEEFAEDVSVDA